MKKLLLALSISFCLSPASHAGQMDNQLNALRQAELQNESAKRQQIAAEQAKTKAEQQRQAAAQAAYERKQAAARAAAAERQQKLDAERAAARQKEAQYTDSLRDMDLEARKLELERQRARIKRENEFIDQELKRESAKTDNIQSDADAKRAVSQGAKELMQKEGDARVKKESGWFN